MRDLSLDLCFDLNLNDEIYDKSNINDYEFFKRIVALLLESMINLGINLLINLLPKLLPL